MYTYYNDTNQATITCYSFFKVFSSCVIMCITVDRFTTMAHHPQHHTRGLTAQSNDPGIVVAHLSTYTVPQTHHTPWHEFVRRRVRRSETGNGQYATHSSEHNGDWSRLVWVSHNEAEPGSIHRYMGEWKM